MPRDFNAERSARATSDREFILGPFTFKRVVSAAPEVLLGFHRPDETNLDQAVLDRFDETTLALIENDVIDNRTGEKVPKAEAWHFMRHEGDENGVVAFTDMGEIVTMLLGGVVERPTESPSDLSDGSLTPSTGTNSTDTSLSEEPVSTPLMHVVPSTPVTPAS